MRTRLQVAADAAAMAGTDALAEGTGESAAIAKRFAELNFNDADPLDVVPSEDIEFGTWDEETRVFRLLPVETQADANAVRVTCRRTQARGNAANLFFAQLLGRSMADVSAAAVARAKPSTCGRIIGLRRVTMTGSSYTDSYDSSIGPYGSSPPRGRGHVCSNGPIVTSGSTRINGNAHPGENDSVVGSVTITGNNSPLTQSLDFPPVDSRNAEAINDNIRIPLTADGDSAIVGNNLMVNGGDSLDLPSGVFYFRGVTLTGGGTLRATGPAVIFIDGNCHFSGGSIVNVSQKPSNLQLYCSGATCTISGSVDFHGVIYAPNTRISRTGSSNIYGMLLGRELNLSGSGGVHADESLGPLKGIRNRYTVLVD
jgi:hypothetical protein